MLNCSGCITDFAHTHPIICQLSVQILKFPASFIALVMKVPELAYLQQVES
jgi:hypothetical protein